MDVPVKVTGLIILLAALAAAALACGGRVTTPPSPTAAPSPATTSSPTAAPSPATTSIMKSATVTGAISYRADVSIPDGAIFEVLLEDVSLADAPSVVIARQALERPWKVPASFEVEYAPQDIDPAMRYAVSASIRNGDELLFINTTMYNVLTYGSPSHVEIDLERVADFAVAATPNTGAPNGSPPESPGEPSPVQSVSITPSVDGFSLQIVSVFPNYCHRVSGHSLSVADDVINATLTAVDESKTQAIACAQALHEVVTDIPIEAALQPGRRYTVRVNGHTTTTFTLPDWEAGNSITVKSPVERVELVILEKFPPAYMITVYSALPRGSSCSRFNGYDLARPHPNRLEITVTHHEITSPATVPCTRDYPTVETNVPLGEDFIPGQEYTVDINNGQVVETFTAQ